MDPSIYNNSAMQNLPQLPKSLEKNSISSGGFFTRVSANISF